MHTNGWILAAALVFGPAAVAHADVLLDRAHQRLDDGAHLVVQGRYAEAEKPLRQALRDQPNLREAHYNLGAVLRAEGRYDEAIAEYNRALALTSKDKDDESVRARCLYGAALAKDARGDKNAWDEYLAFARPWQVEQPAVQIAEERKQALNEVKVPGVAQKASR
jgi:tetratricopeptide (TPR) repeat protein